MSWGRVLTFDDPFPYHAAFRAADMEMFPTGKGEFRAEVTQVALNEVWLLRHHENLPRVQAGAIKRGRRVFGFLTESVQPELHSCGRLFSPGEIHIHDFGVAHFKSGGNASGATISLPTEELAAASTAINGRAFPNPSIRQYIRPKPEIMERLQQLHAQIGELARTKPEIFSEVEVVRALEQQLIYMLVKCLTDGTVSKSTAGTHRHDLIVARLEEFLEANPNTPLYLSEVCAAIGTAERTLRVVCEQHLGMGPIRYLTLRRMHLARRALQRASPSTATVTQIATDHGFWELGRFSVNYRAIFGEMPSATLHRPPDDVFPLTNRPSHLATS